MRSEAECRKRPPLNDKETTAFLLTNTKNAPDEATNFSERKVNVKREIADN